MQRVNDTWRAQSIEKPLNAHLFEEMISRMLTKGLHVNVIHMRESVQVVTWRREGSWVN